MKFFSAPLLATIAVLSLIGNVLMYMRYSTSRPLATVGSSVITKKEYLDQLENQAGPQVLSKLVFDNLVSQAAAREGLTPTAKDVDARIAAIVRTQPQVLTPYMQDPVKMAEVRQNLQNNIALENLRIQNIALTPAEVAAFYAKNKVKFMLPQQVEATTVVTENSVDAATAADLLHENIPLDALARQPRLHVVGVDGYNPDLATLLPAAKQQMTVFVNTAKAGDVKTFRGGTYYITVHVIKNNGATLPPLAQIRDQVERQARLERAPAPQAEIARLYQAAKPTFNSDKYAAYFAAVQTYPVDKDDSKKTASVQ